MMLNLKEAKSVEIKRYVEKLKKEVIVNLNLSVIDFKWESLLFSDNLENFATVIAGDYIVELITEGEVRIVDTETDSVYKNGNIPYEILSKIRNGDIYEDDRYVVDNNNWFALHFGIKLNKEGDTIQYQTLDDLIFEANPESIDELIEKLIEYTVYFLEVEKSRDGIKPYLAKCDDVEIIIDYAILDETQYEVTHIDEDVVGEDNVLGSSVFNGVLIIKDFFDNYRNEAYFHDEEADSISLEIKEFIDSNCIKRKEVYVHTYDKNGEKLRTRTIKLQEELPF